MVVGAWDKIIPADDEGTFNCVKLLAKVQSESVKTIDTTDTPLILNEINSDQFLKSRKILFIYISRIYTITQNGPKTNFKMSSVY